MQLFFGLSVWWSDSKVGNRIKTRSGSRPYPLRGMVDAGDDTISKIRIRRANPARGEQSSRNSGGVLLAGAARDPCPRYTLDALTLRAALRAL
ncbi:hypothetical protein, partial [Xanthomonas citri]